MCHFFRYVHLMYLLLKLKWKEKIVIFIKVKIYLLVQFGKQYFYKLLLIFNLYRIISKILGIIIMDFSIKILNLMSKRTIKQNSEWIAIKYQLPLLSDVLSSDIHFETTEDIGICFTSTSFHSLYWLVILTFPNLGILSVSYCIYAVYNSQFKMNYMYNSNIY